MLLNTITAFPSSPAEQRAAPDGMAKKQDPDEKAPVLLRYLE
jgi:hypothetical protein